VSASIEFRETGVLLKMTPTVYTTEAGQKITTIVAAELSDRDTSVALDVPVGSQTVSVPGFKVRKINTEVTTSSGESIVIAGLLKVEDTHNVSQVPAVGSLPVLGRLFRNPEKEFIQREVVIVVTPELLTPAAPASAKAPADERTTELEEALDTAQVKVVPSVEDPVLRYALTVQERVAQAIKFPFHQPSSPMGGRVKLRLHLFRDGTLGRAVVAESSGIDSFDTEAVKAAELQSPYPAFPSEITHQDLWLEVPVVFRPD
jgi:TonB family protein